MLVLSVYILVFLRIGVTSRSWNTFFNLHFFSKYTLCLEFWNFENFLLGKTHHYIDFWKVKHIFLWIWGLFSSFLLLAWTNVAIWDSRGEQKKNTPQSLWLQQIYLKNSSLAFVSNEIHGYWECPHFWNGSDIMTTVIRFEPEPLKCQGTNCLWRTEGRFILLVFHPTDQREQKSSSSRKIHGTNVAQSIAEFSIL